jgi:predicted ATP-grasp superfamily ATP-dependent carboligase
MNSRMPLDGKVFGVLGFNARPIACSLKKMGARVIVSDYWGDEDLDRCCDKWLALLAPTPGKRQRQPLDMPLPEALVENLDILLQNESVDHIILGSGFDDHPDVLEKYHKMGILLGNSPSTIKKARDKKRLAKIAAKSGINVPFSGNVDDTDSALATANEIGFPVLVRPPTSGGGSGIRFARNEEELTASLKGSGKFIIQQYICGQDFSTSIVAAAKDTMTLSIQGQLIGMPSAGRNCDFAYSGNYLPFRIDRDHREKIGEFSSRACAELGLRGSNGFDFVEDHQSNLWLMEINPRLQGTLELLEIASQSSITMFHYQACLKSILPERVEAKPGVKMIVYARRRISVPDLGAIEGTFDRTPKGVVLEAGDPICTVIEVGVSLSQCYQKASEKARLIWRQ